MAQNTSRADRVTASPACSVSIAEAAEQCNVSSKTIRCWITAGQLPAYRVGPRFIRIDFSDLNRIVRRIPTVGDAA